MLTNEEWPDIIAISSDEVDMFIELFENARETKMLSGRTKAFRHRFARAYEQLLTHARSLKEIKK